MYNYYDNQDFGDNGCEGKQEDRCGFGSYEKDGFDGYDGKGGWDPKFCCGGKEEKRCEARKTCFCCQEIECPKPKPKPCPPKPKCDCCSMLAAAFCRCCGGKRW